MGRIYSFLVLFLCFTSTAHATTLGLTCEGKTHIIVAPNLFEAEACALKIGACNVGFTVEGGYYALAQSANGAGQGAAAGYRSETSVAERALSKCTALNAGACAIVDAGFDDKKSTLGCNS
jgi:hypothetical protein